MVLSPTRAAAACALLSLAAHAADETIRPYLEKGPLVFVEQDASGKFAQATAIVLIDAPVEKVWDIATDFEKWVQFAPKVTTSHVVRKEANEVDVRWVIDVPGPDSDYTIRYVIDPKAREAKGHQLRGDLKGSHWSFKAEPTPDGKTLFSYSAAIKNFSSFAQSIEDEQQTITVGVNVTSVLSPTKAVKRRAESKK